jgi:flavin-dependent dehydrogenase
MSSGLDDLDVLILGGGPAGSAAAIELARGGRRVAILERSLTPHDKVCGDFLSGEAVADLAHLGVNPAALNAVAIHHVRLAGPLGISSARLPFAAQSLTRRALDDALLGRAADSGVQVLRGHAAQSLQCRGCAWSVEVSAAGGCFPLHAADLILATGKHDLRGRPRPAGVHSGLIGFKMYLRLAPGQRAAVGDGIELVLLRGGYSGLSLVEDNIANLCFVLRRAAELCKHPHLRTRLAGAEPLLARPLAISPIPYGFVRHAAIASGLWSVGDQAAVIPSFTGDGIALALHSGRLAAQAMLSGASAEAFQHQFHAQVHRQVARATVLSRALTAQPQRTVLEVGTRLFPRALTLVAAGTRLAPQFRLPRRIAPRISPCENTCATA